jgi:hypothetical protein
MWQDSEGKLTQSDEGELEFKITPYKERVIMDWGKLVQWIGLTPPSMARATIGGEIRL